MALHGTIEVNNRRIGFWSATRIATALDGWHTYDCEVRTDATHTQAASRQTFRLRHQYANGALVLAAMVLADAVDLVTDGED